MHRPIAASILLALFLTLPLGFVASASTGSWNGLPTWARLPTVPPPIDGKPTCWILSNGAWVVNPDDCVPVPQNLIPTEGGLHHPIYGVDDNFIERAATSVDVSQYSGEYDNRTNTAGTYSVQLNTNIFVGNLYGSNGDEDWDQFVFQNQPNVLTDECIVQWDLSQSTSQPLAYPDSYCQTISQQLPLETAFQVVVQGSATSGYLSVTVSAPSYTPTALSLTDVLGLEYDNWGTTSGTILGAGLSSTADFYSPATVYTDVGTYSSNEYYSQQSDTNTGEMNNLYYTSTGPAGCDTNYVCWEDTVSSTSSGGGSLNLNVNSVNYNTQSPITGYYTQLDDSSYNELSYGYTPTTYSVTYGSNYLVYADGYGNCNFYQWSDGSTSMPHPVTPYGDTTLTAEYTGSSC